MVQVWSLVEHFVSGTVCFCSYSTTLYNISFFQAHRYPDHGHLVNIFLFYGFEEHIVLFGGITYIYCFYIKNLLPYKEMLQ